MRGVSVVRRLVSHVDDVAPAKGVASAVAHCRRDERVATACKVPRMAALVLVVVFVPAAGTHRRVAMDAPGVGRGGETRHERGETGMLMEIWMGDIMVVMTP